MTLLDAYFLRKSFAELGIISSLQYRAENRESNEPCKHLVQQVLSPERPSTIQTTSPRGNHAQLDMLVHMQIFGIAQIQIRPGSWNVLRLMAFYSLPRSRRQAFYAKSPVNARTIA